MEPEHKKKRQKLTVVDWCVLAALLVGIASMSRPGITLARQEQQLANMVERLQMMRSHILLYRAEHDGLLPGQSRPGEAVTSAGFAAAMREYRPHGYASLGGIPENPYIVNPRLSAEVTCVNDPYAEPSGREGTGWWFNAATGEFFACDCEFHTRY